MAGTRDFQRAREGHWFSGALLDGCSVWPRTEPRCPRPVSGGRHVTRRVEKEPVSHPTRPDTRAAASACGARALLQTFSEKRGEAAAGPRETPRELRWQEAAYLDDAVPFPDAPVLGRDAVRVDLQRRARVSAPAGEATRMRIAPAQAPLPPLPLRDRAHFQKEPAGDANAVRTAPHQGPLALHPVLQEGRSTFRLLSGPLSVLRPQRGGSYRSRYAAPAARSSIRPRSAGLATRVCPPLRDEPPHHGMAALRLSRGLCVAIVAWLTNPNLTPLKTQLRGVGGAGSPAEPR